MDIVQEVKTRQDSSFTNLKTKRDLWDQAEQLFHGQLNDSISASTKSQVFDPKLASLALERSYRVMAQLATGKVRNISKNDIGSSKLINLVLDKYVNPNAKAQFDLLTKYRMVDLYSQLYGNFFTLIDWDVRKNGYVGPDMWLLNIRDVFPQVGAVSLQDSDYIIIRTWRPLSFFENLKKQDGYKNIDKIVAKLSDKSGSKQARDSENVSKREENQYPESEPAKGMGYFEVYSQFEGDRWVDVCADADMEFRDTANPHKNGELPVECKYSIPLLDDFMGFGDFERGGPMQKVVNSVWNLYLDALKISIFPPTLVNKDNIASMSSLKWGAAEKWLVRNQINNAVQPIQLSPQGIAEFNNTYQVATAAILNMFGTTDTTVTQQTDPGMGKTPEALQMQKARENTRDAADRYYMEQFVTNVNRKFVNLISKKQTSAITFRLFEEEIKELKRSYPEIAEMYDEKTGKVSINKSKTGSSLYDYEIVSGSTYALDQKAQQDNLSMLLGLYLKSQTPQGNLLVNDLGKSGYLFNFGELFKRVISNSGITDWDKILTEKTEDEKSDDTVMKNNQVFMSAFQQMMGNGMNAVPPQPQGGPQQGAPQTAPQTAPIPQEGGQL